jgi:hypothetical protein
MMLKMVFLQLLIEGGQFAMVKEVVGKVVADVAKNSPTKHGGSDVPVIREECVCKLPEWECENDEQSGWHHESIFVHRKIVMNSMEKEMSSESNTVIWKVSTDD